MTSFSYDAQFEKDDPRLAVGEEECRDLLAATLDGALWHQLVSERGWSDERFAQMLGTMLVAALVHSKR